MGTTEDAELPVVGGAEQIRQREFATVRRGYDPDAGPRATWQLVSDQVEPLERSLTDARARVTELEAELRAAASDASPGARRIPTNSSSKRFANVLVTADSEAAHVVEQARAEAEHIKAEATARAEEARMRSSQTLFAAREESDRMLANLAERRAAMLEPAARDAVAAALGGRAISRWRSSRRRSPRPRPPSSRHLHESDPELDPAGPELPDLSMLDFDLDDDATPRS